MIEKLIVEKFGPIKKMELDLSKILILIGPQSVGKSTIAKLVAILRDFSFVLRIETFEEALEKYGIQTYLRDDSFIKYKSEGYSFVYQNGRGRMTTNKNHQLNRLMAEFANFEKENPRPSLPEHKEKIQKDLNELSTDIEMLTENSEKGKTMEEIKKSLDQLKFESKLLDQREEYKDKILTGIFKYINYSVYIPAERILIPVISNSIMNFLKHEIPIPKILTEFASNFEKARQKINEFSIDFLNITFKFIKNENRLYLTKRNYIKLSEASSGLQTLIPLLLVIKNKYSETREGNTYVIEEPELNLYPENQYKLSKIIAKICSGFNPNQGNYNELIITTHSPYILAAFNNFLLANKIGESGEYKDKVSTVIDEESWIDPSRFNAYYLSKKGIKKIFDEKTGLIAENQLDSASEAIMIDFDKLMDLYSQNLIHGKSNSK